MTQHNEIKIFGEQQVRSVWDDTAEEWYFDVADVVAVLTDSVNPTDYIKKMRQRDPELAKGWGQIVTPLSIQIVEVNRRHFPLDAIRLNWILKIKVPPSAIEIYL